MFHLLEAEVDREPFPASLTIELLNIPVLVSAYSVFLDVLGLAEDANMNVGYGLNDSRRDLFT